jgi:hypothetical protein
MNLVVRNFMLGKLCFGLIFNQTPNYHANYNKYRERYNGEMIKDSGGNSGVINA